MEQLPHHIQQELCTTRPAYRQGRKLTAVKVYTVASESRHLLFHGVPDINVRPELKSTLSKLGKLEKLVPLPDYPDKEAFTAVYHAVFLEITSARLAKRRLDATSFYGGVLHVCYAPELESIDELSLKLQERKADVIKRLKINSRAPVSNNFGESSSQLVQAERKFIKRPERPAQDVKQTKKVYGPQLPEKSEKTHKPKKTSSNIFIPNQIRLAAKRNASLSGPSSKPDVPTKKKGIVFCKNNKLP
ncbi:RNA-binding protein 48 [Neocloeon triangulifer]|uniref:RNA-binding protein 48 n=1 Tax=Neocloeon triangulifer TaxID=2078957 RepID=UPI00286FA30F|nr:RNA-binding protein 48 [Neocloeon triangulifer]